MKSSHALEIEITHTHTQRRRVEINEKYLRDEREEKTRDKTKKEKKFCALVSHLEVLIQFSAARPNSTTSIYRRVYSLYIPRNGGCSL